jgi:tricorn protease-like protein
MPLSRSHTAFIFALLVSIACAAPAQASFSGSNGQIAFDNLITINPDGTQLMDPFPPQGERPDWSPDGNRIAFQTSFQAALNTSSARHIFTMNLDGSALTQLTHSGADNLQPSWSPDGRRIVFIGLPEVGEGTELYVMNADGTDQIRLTYTRASDFPPNSDQWAEGNPEWSPDGSRIVYQKGIYTITSGLWTIKPDGTAQTSLGQGDTPDWSPDGTKIAFSMVTDPSDPTLPRAIFVMNADGTGRAQLTSGPDDHGPAWSPDGTKIAFHKYFNTVDIVNADGTNRKPLTPVGFGYRVVYPDWQPCIIGITRSCVSGFHAPPASPPDGELGSAALKLKLSGKRSQRINRTGAVYVIAQCNKDCKVTGSASVRMRRSARRMLSRAVRRTLALGKKVKLRMQFAQKRKKRILRALRHRKRLKTRVTVRANATAGSGSDTARLAITLKR